MRLDAKSHQELKWEKLLLLNVQLLHPPVEGGAADAEVAGGGSFVAAVLLETGEDEFLDDAFVGAR